VRRWAARLGTRIGLPLVAVAGLIAIGLPLASSTALRRSQAAAATGDTATALLDARAAARVEPDAASPQLQQALVLELRSDFAGAVEAASRATIDEPLNWKAWLVRSRVEAEAGRPGASLRSYRRAKSLNPKSVLFG
jgi:tetratricopeptide (TPR) repeat protein